MKLFVFFGTVSTRQTLLFCPFTIPGCSVQLKDIDFVFLALHRNPMDYCSEGVIGRLRCERPDLPDYEQLAQGVAMRSGDARSTFLLSLYHEFSHAGVPLGFNGPKLRTGIEMYTYVLKHWVKLSRFRGGNSGSYFENYDLQFEILLAFAERLRNVNLESGPPLSCAYHGREIECHRLFHCLL